MRILLLGPHPYYVDRGTPIDVDLLVRALSEHGHRVDLVCYPDGEERSYAGVTIHRIRAPRVLRGTPPGFTFRKVFKDLLLALSAFKLVRRHDYDVVHAGEESVFVAMLLQRLFGLPYVYDMDSSIAQQVVEQIPALSLLSPLLDRMEGAAIRRSTATAPVCNALADVARDRGAPFVETLHDISQLPSFLPAPTGFLRKDRGIRNPILMYVGNLQPYQGIDLLLESFAIALRDGTKLDLVIAGGSDQNIAKYRRRAVDLGVDSHTHFLGPWPNDDLPGLLAEADILTAPRIRGLNTPMKIFPYMHTGKPVLVTDLPTHNQILDSSVAMLAPAEPEAFASAITRLVQDETLRGEIGRNGRQLVEENHTYSAHRARVGRLYEFVADEVGKASRPSSPAGAGLEADPR